MSQLNHLGVGEVIPKVRFPVREGDAWRDLTTEEIFADKTVVVFALPGAFTPTCSNNHLPGYLENRDAILARGVDTIAVVATNDVHVMGAWARFTGGEGKILYLSDGNGDFVRTAGLEVDLAAAGMGRRQSCHRRR